MLIASPAVDLVVCLVSSPTRLSLKIGSRSTRLHVCMAEGSYVLRRAVCSEAALAVPVFVTWGEDSYATRP